MDTLAPSEWLFRAVLIYITLAALLTIALLYLIEYGQLPVSSGDTSAERAAQYWADVALAMHARAVPLVFVLATVLGFDAGRRIDVDTRTDDLFGTVFLAVLLGTACFMILISAVPALVAEPSHATVDEIQIRAIVANSSVVSVPAGVLGAVIAAIGSVW